MQREDKLHMTSDAFNSKCLALFSTKRSESRKAFCKLTGCTEATVSRYASGKQVIPLTVANLLFEHTERHTQKHTETCKLTWTHTH